MDGFFLGFLILLGAGWVYRKELAKKYSDFSDLNKLVATRDTNKFRIFWVSLTMVFKMYWLMFIAWANDSVKILNRRTAIITYFVNRKEYKMVTTINGGPPPVLLVISKDRGDISSMVLPYLGPAHDWHGTHFTPNFWDQDEITFELSSGEQKTFKRYDTITI